MQKLATDKYIIVTAWSELLPIRATCSPPCQISLHLKPSTYSRENQVKCFLLFINFALRLHKIDRQTEVHKTKQYIIKQSSAWLHMDRLRFRISSHPGKVTFLTKRLHGCHYRQFKVLNISF